MKKDLITETTEKNKQILDIAYKMKNNIIKLDEDRFYVKSLEMIIYIDKIHLQSSTISINDRKDCLPINVANVFEKRIEYIKFLGFNIRTKEIEYPNLTYSLLDGWNHEDIFEICIASVEFKKNSDKSKKESFEEHIRKYSYEYQKF
jgi:hypothetical protein